MSADVGKRQSDVTFFTWSSQNTAKPLHITAADGIWITLDSGERLMDFKSQSFNVNIGHGHPAVRDAIIAAASGPPLSIGPAVLHPARAQLGEDLCRVAPDGLCKAFVCLGGADANENAIKMARLFTGKRKIVTRYRSYHGATLGTSSYGGDYRRIPFDGYVTGVVRVPDPAPHIYGDVDTVRFLEEAIEMEGPETIAAVLMEGVTGANGVFEVPDDYWPRVRALCDKHDILLIADEVLSGFGRTGKMFAMEHFGVTPDILTTAKGLTSGYAPLGAVLVTERIAAHFDENTLWAGLTAYAPPLSCAVASAVIDVTEREGLVQNAAARGLEVRATLDRWAAELPMVARVRGMGLLWAVDLLDAAGAPLSAYRASPAEAAAQAKLVAAMRTEGVLGYVRSGSLILAPPLCITAAELQDGLARIERVLRTELCA